MRAVVCAWLILSGGGFAQEAIAAALPALPTPGQPIEGQTATKDEDFDGDGRYRVFWTAVQQAGLRILAYELQEAATPQGPWVRIASTRGTSFQPRLKLHGRQFFYRVRVQDATRRWSEWSAASDGILVDRTAPVIGTVTDDGEATAATDRLHATWSGNDPESGMLAYEYEIRQDSPGGRLIVAWKPAGTATEVTVAQLRLKNGVRYYVGVRAKNRAGLLSKPRHSDGIIARPIDRTPPKIVIVYPQNGALLGAR